MDWEEQKPGKRIPVSEKKGTRLDSWNDACTFISTKAINPLHFGSRFRFQALQVTSNSTIYKKKRLFFTMLATHHLKNHSLMETKPNFATETEHCTDVSQL